MPGGYTHLTMANELAQRRFMEQMPNMPSEAVTICGYQRNYCELGVVSPDYPYLKLMDSQASHWADLFHNNNTDGVVRECIAALRAQTGERRDKGLAWLLGYVTHIVMDVTMHPVVNEKVGPYIDNKRDHRFCEMNQDVWIFKNRMNLSVKLSEFLTHGVRSCGPDASTLDPDILALWSGALARVYPAEFANHAPDPGAWHQWFGIMVDKVAEEGDWLCALSRHVLKADPAISYPPEDELDMDFINALPTPGGGTIEFNVLFDKAKANAAQLWPLIARAVLQNDDSYQASFAHWDLDTGKDRAGKLVFWS